MSLKGTSPDFESPFNVNEPKQQALQYLSEVGFKTKSSHLKILKLGLWDGRPMKGLCAVA